MFPLSPHPSSGVLKTVTAAPGTGHNIGAATSLNVARGALVTDAAVTVFSTTYDGCGDTRNM